MKKYDQVAIEKKWRRFWKENETFKVDLQNAPNPFYNLMMFPYPSGEGLHVGHVYAFGGADSFGRFQRMQGKDVFEPMGFDAFGIHSENYAIKKNTHPKKLTEETTRYFREEQLEKLGALFAWDKSVNTTDPDYYRWTQWLFLRLYKAKLAVKKKAPVNFCPSCKTVLADEQVIDGRCERCNTQVVQKFLTQWFFKITDYAGRLLSNLEKLDWSETTIQMQRNWIGKSEGVEVDFNVVASNAKQSQPQGVATASIDAQPRNDKIRVFTTRPDTIFGATFLVLAPEHELVQKLIEDNKEARDYVEKALLKSEVDRLSQVKEKTGVFSGHYAVNPLNGREVPIWVADYVLSGYGTGAIMAVPAHDQRDFEFAKKYDLEIIDVVERPQEWEKDKAYPAQGKLINSGNFDGQDSEDAKKTISKYIEEQKYGSMKTNYHLRDWLISRQRYWGPPIPIIYCASCRKQAKGNEGEVEGWDYTVLDGVEYAIKAVPEKDLPVLLPEVEDFKPLGTGESPLASVEEFVRTKCPDCGKEARRETDVSDTFLDSSWYFLRYPSADLDQAPFDRELTKKWLPVDVYIGGNEHAVLHLLYSRFVTMVLKDLGELDFEEPYKRFRAHGLIIHGGAKMSKSRGNVINPNEYMEKYGADVLRMYLLFLGPYEQGGDFSVRGIGGVDRFLKRVVAMLENLSTKNGGSDKKDPNIQVRNQTIKKVTRDFETLHFNTVTASLMEYLNHLSKAGATEEDAKTLLILMAPLVPHFAEEMWQTHFGEEKFKSIHDQSWPEFDPDLKSGLITIVVQIDGRVRERLEVAAGLDQKGVERLALDQNSVKKYIGDDKSYKVIFVEGKLLNFVTSK
jgi:leucyl-tRNA synthetase